MTDNVNITEGNGDKTIATDDVGGVQYQIVKVAYGADGVATIVSSSNLFPASLPNVEYAEDAAHTTGDKGIMVLAVQKTADAALSGDGDYSPIQLDERGKVKVASGYVKTLTDTKTRPANVTPYTIGDVIDDDNSADNGWLFADAARFAGGSGFIMEAMLLDSSNETTKLSADLLLFKTQPTSPNDNETNGVSDTDLLELIGVVSFDDTNVINVAAGSSGNCVYIAKNIAIPFTCHSSDTDLYGLLVTKNAYVPISGEVFTIKLKLLQE